MLLTRTGTPESAHRGITALFVDMDSPGITVRPIETMHGAQEFCEVFFDDVVVPLDRILGEEDHGWSIAMDLLPYERSTALWHRAAYLQRRLQQLVDAAPARTRSSPAAVGEVTQLLWAFRARSRATQRRLAAGERARAGDLHRQGPRGDGRAGRVRPRRPRASVPRWRSGDDPVSRRWRAEFLYSRAATIYGGSAEIQRNIIARRLLDLGSDR